MFRVNNFYTVWNFHSCEKFFCWFFSQRLKYTPRGVVTIDGFSELPDADPDDIEPWLPRFPGNNTNK